MSSVFTKWGYLYIRVKQNGRWVSRSTGLPAGRGHEDVAREAAEKLQARIDAAAELGLLEEGPTTVSTWVKRWLKQRKALGVVDCANDEQRLRDYVEPHVGAMPIAKVRPRHLADLFQTLRTEPRKDGDEPLAPKTIWNIYSTCKALFRDAVIADLIQISPCILTEHHIGECVDKDPEWRDSAVFTREEIEALISDPRIPWDRRVYYGLVAIAGLRHGEAAGVRWRHYDAHVEPLGGLRIERTYVNKRTKTKRSRTMPVHPVLAAMLAEWKLGGWAAMVGRPPEPDDLIVPLEPDAQRKAKGRRPNPRALGVRSKSDAYKRLRADLDTLGLRHRGLHIFRATMISLAVNDGASEAILERGTHNPRRRGGGVGTAIRGYVRGLWEPICNEVAKLRIRRKTPAPSSNVVALDGGGV
jgi:integrase